MSSAIDSRDSSTVAALVRSRRRELYGEEKSILLDRVFPDVTAMFEGRFGDFAPIDLSYHDFPHTLQAAACLTELLAGRHRSGALPVLDARHFDVAVAAALLHDTGYLKTRADRTGTGAKYTYTHVLRSCSVAASYLPLAGASLAEIDLVVAAIRCTGPGSIITRLNFPSDFERTIGCSLATADFLSQMAASDYPRKLARLFSEFEESDNFLNVPRAQRVFRSADDLLRRTPDFWRKLVEPKLREDFQGVFRFLAHPYPDGPNPYLSAIEHNLATIRMMTEAPAAAVR